MSVPDMNQRQTCPNCKLTPVRPVFAIGPGNDVVECAGCRLQFAEAYPEYDSADAAIYPYEYFSSAIAQNDRREKIFADLLSELESVLPKKGRLLDVGAGEGTLLKVATNNGWKAEGTEISSAMIEHVRALSPLTLHHGVLEDIQLPEDSFDAVILNHVLEHVRNPRTTLERVARLLTPDGVVRIEVPNLASLSSRFKNLQSRLRLKSNPWRHYSTGHHFWFFTPLTLRTTLRGAGLDTIVLGAPAKQWGNKSPVVRSLNGLYRITMWGGHIVAYARRGATTQDTTIRPS